MVLKPIVSLPSIKNLTLAEVQETFFLAPSPDVIDLQPGQRLVAIGDVHGNYHKLCSQLRVAGIVSNDDAMDWIGGNTIAVQVGDLLDRGNGEIQSWQLLCKLSRQAQAEGGHVILLFGNHESMNMIGCFECAPVGRDSFEIAFGAAIDGLMRRKRNKVDPEKIPALTDQDDEAVVEFIDNWSEEYIGFKYKRPYRFAAMEPGGLLSGPLLSKLKVAVRVGRSILVHAGLKKETLNKIGGDIPKINNFVSSIVMRKAEPKMPNYTSRVEAIEQIGGWFLDDSLSDDEDPLWTRDFGCGLKKEGVKELVESVLKCLNADRMIIGHTTQDHIVGVYDETIWRVDVDGLSEVLEFSCQEEDDEGTCKEIVKILGRKKTG